MKIREIPVTSPFSEPSFASPEGSFARQEPSEAPQEPSSASSEPSLLHQEPSQSLQEASEARQEPSPASSEPSLLHPEATFSRNLTSQTPPPRPNCPKPDNPLPRKGTEARRTAWKAAIFALPGLHTVVS